MYEELKARLKWLHIAGQFTTVGNRTAAGDSIEAIEQLERHLAERDAEIAKYRDAPVVAWVNKSAQNYVEWNSYFSLPNSTPLIVKPGEQ